MSSLFNDDPDASGLERTMTASMTGWSELVFAFALFVTSHMIPARPIARAWLLRHMGKTAYLVAYTGLSILVLGWLILGSRLCALSASLGACCLADVDHKRHHAICLLTACIRIAAPNRLSIASRNDTAYDPDHPGIVGCTRHPVLWAATLWASAHVPPNGDLAHVIVFCWLAALGVFGALIVDIESNDFSAPQSGCDYPPTRYSCRSSRFLPEDGSPAAPSRFFSTACCNCSLFQLSDAARHRYWRIAASAALSYALVARKTPWIISTRRSSSAFFMQSSPLVRRASLTSGFSMWLDFA